MFASTGQVLITSLSNTFLFIFFFFGRGESGVGGGGGGDRDGVVNWDSVLSWLDGCSFYRNP